MASRGHLMPHDLRTIATMLTHHLITMKKAPIKADVTLASINITVSTSPEAKGYETLVRACDPKSESVWTMLPLAAPFRFQIGRTASHPEVMSVPFQIMLRNSPQSSPNHDSSAPATSAYWQGKVTADTNFVFILPKA